jgi:tetratricopeptide (TPR) repeat protein
MAEITEITSRLRQLVDERAFLENKIQNEHGEMSSSVLAGYDRSYSRLQKSLSQLFREITDESQRITLMMELMRILETKLVYLQNFTVDATADNRMLAALVDRFLDQVGRSPRSMMSALEATYYRAIVALYAGDNRSAREGFQAACASEESDEANDIKYKSYVILGNLSHEEADYARARDFHEKSLQYSQNKNVTAQALAFKALNSYALNDYDEALQLFESSLELFDSNEPFFNSYFYRNALLFCGLIYFDRKDWEKAEKAYRKVVEQVEPSSYDHFDALARLGKIYYALGRFGDAAQSLTRAIERHRFSENEYLVDTYFWLAKAHLKGNNVHEARRCLEKIAASEVKYDKKPQALDLLQRV